MWPDDAGLARWLRDNFDVLTDLTGMSLGLVPAELLSAPQGMALTGLEQLSGSSVLVACQVQGSAEGDLESLLSLATGVAAETVVWVTTGLLPEHRAAVDWLNSRTTQSTRFFAVIARLVRIGESPPAPAFELATGPEHRDVPIDQARQTLGEAAPEQDETYERFWAQAWARIRRDWPSWPLTREPTSPSWLDTDSGLDGVALLMIFRSGDLEFQVYFGDPDERLNRARFAALTSVAHEFEAAVGIPLQWDAMEGRRAARIRTRSGRGYRVEDESRWGEMTDWLAEMQLRFRAGLSAIGWPDSFRGIIVSQAAPGELSRRRRDDAPV